MAEPLSISTVVGGLLVGLGFSAASVIVGEGYSLVKDEVKALYHKLFDKQESGELTPDEEALLETLQRQIKSEKELELQNINDIKDNTPDKHYNFNKHIKPRKR